MGNVVEFAQRWVQLDPQFGLATQISALQMFLEENAKIFEVNIEALAKSLRDIDSIACHIDDSETREKMQLRSQSIRREFFLALQKLLNGLAPGESS